MSKLTAFCAWGDGPDVGINIPPSSYRVLKNGLAIVDMTADEAFDFAITVLAAVAQARKLDAVCQQHDESTRAEGEP